MISTARLHRRSVLLPRAPARYGDRLSPPQPMSRTLTQMTPLNVHKVTLPTGIPGVLHLR